MLQDGGEEKKQLHFGQVLPNAHTLTCRKPAVSRSPTNVCKLRILKEEFKKNEANPNLLKMAERHLFCGIGPPSPRSGWG